MVVYESSLGRGDCKHLLNMLSMNILRLVLGSWTSSWPISLLTYYLEYYDCEADCNTHHIVKNQCDHCGNIVIVYAINLINQFLRLKS